MSNRKLTDGQLAKEDMRRRAHYPDMAAELVDRGWREDRGGHHLIVHHIDYQRTAQEVAHQSTVPTVPTAPRARLGQSVVPKTVRQTSRYPIRKAISRRASHVQTIRQTVRLTTGTGHDRTGQG